MIQIEGDYDFGPVTPKPLLTPKPLSYDVTRLVIQLVSKLYFRVEVTHVGAIPEVGGFVLAPVHRSNLDPPLCSILTKRRLCFMAKRGLFANVFFGAYLRSLGAIPVARGSADIGAFKNCLSILKAGHGLVVFPEGTRKTGSAISELEEGAISLAQRGNVPVIPVGIFGSDVAFGPGAKFPRRTKIRMVVGVPIPPEDITSVTLRESLQALIS